MSEGDKKWKDQWTYLILAGVFVLAVAVGFTIRYVRSGKQDSVTKHAQEMEQNDSGAIQDVEEDMANEGGDAGGSEQSAVISDMTDAETGSDLAGATDGELPNDANASQEEEDGEPERDGKHEKQEYILPDSDRKYYKMKELKGLSAKKARIARNELFARHGRKFDDEELQAYFNSCSWYSGTIEPDDFDEESMFNKYEIANRNLIIKYETKRGYR